MSKPLQLNVTRRNLVDSDKALKRITSEKISARMSYTLSLVLSATEPFVKAEGAGRDKLLAKYGEPVKDQPGVFLIPPEHAEAYQKEYSEMLDETATLVNIGRIRLSALEKEGVKMSGEEVSKLSWLLKQDVNPVFEEGDPEPESED